MISPQEAESRVFSKASFGGGYNMAQVDAFLDELISDYAALYKENAALKGKMKVLAEKLEEYRATEDAMRRTLLSAQKMADTMVKEAEATKVDAIAKAELESKTRIEEIRREVANEEMRLNAARNSTTVYVEKLKELYTHEFEYISRLAEMIAAPGAGSLAKDPVKEIEDKVSALIGATQTPSSVDAVENPTVRLDETAMAAIAATPVAAAPAAAEETKETKRALEESDTVVFDRLQFGRDYQFE